MSDNRTQPTDREECLDEAVAAYFQAADAGRAPDRQEWLARYPAVAGELEHFFAGIERVDRLAAPLRLLTPAVSGVANGDGAGGLGRLGDFHLLREVGRGGMGVVYEAEQISLGRRVALKVLPFAATMDRRQLQRFHNEARAAAGLHHNNIVPVHAVGEERGVHYYAMQFIHGQTLAAMIADLGRQGSQAPLPEAQATTPHVRGAPAPETVERGVASTERSPRDPAYFRQVAEWGIQGAEALDYAHGVGIIHRDVKPANLLVDDSGRLWVTDFGLAQVKSDARLTMTGDLVGTLRYMSPEQALAKRVIVDHRTDVYSLGATLYEMLTLEPVYSGGDRQELLRQIAFEEPCRLRQITKTIPAELETIVLKAMQKNPQERYATAQELANDLRHWLMNEPIHARRPTLIQRARKWAARHRVLVGAAAFVLLLAVTMLAGTVGWVTSDRSARRRATEQVVTQALEESESWQDKRRLPEALSAARRAAGLVVGGEADEALRKRVQARADDLELLARLEEARLEGTALRDGHFDAARVLRRFGEIFRESNLDVEGLPIEQAAECLRCSSVAVELAAVLDQWAVGRRQREAHDDARWEHLLRVARAADPHGWRSRLREALGRRDRESLVELASSKQAVDLLPPTLQALGLGLQDLRANDEAIRLLRKAQQLHPDDFWINESLGLDLMASNPPRHGEAIPFLMVAVALRPQSPGAHFNLGNALLDKKDVDGAIAAYRKAIDLNPKYANAHFGLGNALRDKGDVHGAIAECRKGIDLDPKNTMAHNNLGATLLYKGDRDGAIAEFCKAIDLDPKNAQAHSNLGNALRDKGDVHGAIAECRKAIDLDPKFAGAHGNLGNALLDKKDVDGAIAAYRKAIDIDPMDAKSHGNLGNGLLAKKDVDGAIAAFRKAIDIDPKLPGSHYNLGRALEDKADVDGAIAAFRKAIDHNPKDANAHCNLGVALYRKKDVDGAIAAQRKAIALDPMDAKAHSNLGDALRVKGDVDGAIGACRKAIDLDPMDADAHNNLGLALAAKKDVDGAIANLRKAIALNPKDANAHNNLGNVLYTKKDVDGAIAVYHKAIDLNPMHAKAHTNLGVALLAKKDVDAAIAAHRKAIALDPKFAGAHSNLCTALVYKGDLDGAIAESRKAIALDPIDANAHSNLGFALYAKKDVDGAIAEFRKVIDIDPKFARAHYSLGVALGHKADVDEAIAAYREAVRLNEDYPEAHCNLGNSLREKGQFAEALKHLRRGHGLGSSDPRWPYPSAQWVKQCRRFVELDAKLPRVLNGEIQPANIGERLGLAQMCQLPCKSLFAAAARFYTETFAHQPKLADDLQLQHRYNAACAAALAGCGQGKDAAELSDKDRARLRKQALDWLRADLDAWSGLVKKEPDKIRPVIIKQMQHWQADNDFVGVRRQQALAKLPDAERPAWQKLWADIAGALAAAQRKAATEKSEPKSAPPKDKKPRSKQ